MRKSVFSGQVYMLGMIVALALCGCGKQQGIAKVVVEGTVTFNGDPIPNGEIRFYPYDGTHGPVSGGPIKDGKYVAKGRGGVPIGNHRVEIQAFRADKKFASSDGEGGPVVQYLPFQFNSKTSLTATIEESTTTKDFTLTSK